MTANLSDIQKAYFIEMAETSLNDLCTIRHMTGRTQDEYGDYTDTYTDEEDVPCGIKFTSQEYKNELAGTTVVQQVDAILRLPLTQDINENDLVVCRERTFTVDGYDPGRTLKIVSLRYFSTKEE